MDPFITKLILSFVVGAFSVSALSVTAERFGSKLAGALGGFPVTVATSLFFIGMTNGIERAAEATTVIPLLMGLFGLLLALYCGLVPQGLFRGLVGSLGTWIALAAVITAYGGVGFFWSMSAFLLLLWLSYYLVEVRLRVPSSRGAKITLTIPQVFFRCMAGGSVVSLSLYLGTVGGPLLGGLMAAFPAVTVSALIVTYQSGGAALSRAVAKSLMISGMVNVTCYVGAVRYFYPLLGLYGGTAAAFLVSCISGYLTYIFVRERMS